MSYGLNIISVLAQASRPLTREIFGNVPRSAQMVFYVVAAVTIGLSLYGVGRRVRLWRKGTRNGVPLSPRVIIRRIVQDVLLQRRVWGRGLASLAHVLLFSGFIVLTIGTILICIEHVLADLLGRAPGDPVFHKGMYFGFYELVMDTFGLAFLAGCFMFLGRRIRGIGSFARGPTDMATLILLIAIGVSGYIIEGLRIIREQTPSPGLSPVGYLCALGFGGAGINRESVAPLHFAL